MAITTHHHLDKLFVRPWLRKTHPQFFLDYAIKICTQLAVGVYLIFTRDSNFNSPGLQHVNDYLAPVSWGTLHLIVGVGMFMSLHLKSFHMARIFMGCAFVLFLMRGSLLTWSFFDGAAVGLGPIIFLSLAFNLIPSIKEPPVNPATDRR
jgi:hypothetical protein